MSPDGTAGCYAVFQDGAAMKKVGSIDTKGMGRVLAVPHGEFGLRPFICPKFEGLSCISRSADSVCSGYCGKADPEKGMPEGWTYVYCQYADQERKEGVK